jgi:CubicO group peptidase (beta-lactamase class C family)
MRPLPLSSASRWLLYASVGASVLTSALGKGIDNPVLNNDTEAFIQHVLANYSSPGGVGVAVVRKDSTGLWQIETKGYGVATLANGTNVTENTLFAIGSNSKVFKLMRHFVDYHKYYSLQLFDVVATGLLVHNETLSPRLTWTSKLASVIPEFGLEDSIAFQQTNILDAMSHRTGLPPHDLSYRLSDNITSLVSTETPKNTSR